MYKIKSSTVEFSGTGKWKDKDDLEREYKDRHFPSCDAEACASFRTQFLEHHARGGNLGAPASPS
jgi:hypothetical protein